METITRTIYGAHLQTCKLLNKPFTILPNSTLNQKFNILPNEVPNNNEYPLLGYIGIGNRGASYELSSNNFILTTPIPHLPRHGSLYNFIPFVIRPSNADLSSTEKVRYRLRVPITVNGNDYFAYYLRKLSLDTVIPSVELRNVNNGVITSNSFEPTQSDLSPTPPVISSGNLNNPDGDYLVSTAKVTFLLNQTDITEIIDACNILYGDPRYAVINEIALITGVDKISGGYTEVIASQIAAFIYQYHALTTNTTQVQIDLDIGSVEPLLI